MSIFDYEEAPPPPPRYQTKVQKAKVVKDKSLKDEIKYELQWFDDEKNKWGTICLSDTKKKAELEKRNLRETQKKYELGFFKYRIVRLTIKKEVIK